MFNGPYKEKGLHYEVYQEILFGWSRINIGGPFASIADAEMAIESYDRICITPADKIVKQIKFDIS